MHVGEARAPCSLAKALQSFGGRLNPTQTLDQAIEFIDREVRATFDQPVGWELEIALDDIVCHLIECRARDGAGILEHGWNMQFGWVDINPIMVGPHQSKLETTIVWGLQIAPFQASLQKGAIVIVIPVEDEIVDTMIGRCVDLPGEYGRVRFILIAPARGFRLLMARESRLTSLNELPFGPARAMGRLIPGIDVIQRAVISAYCISTGHLSLRTLHTPRTPLKRLPVRAARMDAEQALPV